MKTAKAYLNFQSQRGFSVVCDNCIIVKNKGDSIDQKHIEFGKSIVDPPNLNIEQPCNICGDFVILKNPTTGKRLTIALGEHWQDGYNSARSKKEMFL